MKLASGSSILFVVSFVLLFMKFPEIHGAALNKRDYYLSIEQDATPPAPPPTPPTPPPNAPSAPTPPSIPTSLPPVSIPTTVPNVINTFITTVTVTQTVPGGGGGGGEAPLATPSPIPSLTFPNDTSNATAWSLLSSNPDFKNFTTLLNTTAPDLVELLNSTESNVTVFSPPDSGRIVVG
ncbi:hypothetical protein HMI54_005906 [Coelomomyces lativittatus]|nr:hypothetical protein HMI55_002956 [Coelomomyces lativittatus]KAJ1505478.1 hypothetical protein HMI54_005906 [Coelomomyces lativittatus]